MTSEAVRARSNRVVILVSLLAAAALLACRSTTSSAPEKSTPLSGSDLEIMTSFIKHEQCEPTVCDGVACETFSDGQTKGLPSHVVRCKWTDKRIAGGQSPNRCAYAHYSVDAASHGYNNMFLSTPSQNAACQPDKAFSDLIQGSQGYSGKVP
jgi:hypothetical protein